MNTENPKPLINKVKQILWNDWDPIGVKVIDDSWSDDEYNSYAPSIAKLLVEGADVCKIASRLNQFAEASMGLHSAPEHNTRVAKLLLELVEEKI